MRSDIVPGAVFPDYALPDHTDTVRSLSEVQGRDPMVPYTFVLKPGLVIHSIYNGYWFWGRPSVYDLWRDLREATREVRPDWDLSTPGLREAWDAGHYCPHGWDRRAAAEQAQSAAKSEVAT